MSAEMIITRERTDYHFKDEPAADVGYGANSSISSWANHFAFEWISASPTHPSQGLEGEDPTAVGRGTTYADIPPSPEAEYAARAGGEAMKRWMKENPA